MTMDVNLIEQMRVLTEQAHGSKVELPHTGEVSFTSVFQQALGQVNDLTQNANALKTQFELGDFNTSLGEVMVASQKASLGFEATIRVRNKLVQAYQDIMNLPV